jgi:hypothetical protein
VRPTIDLQAANAEIESRLAGWRDSGIDVGPVTWRDQGAGWPPTITPDRAAVIDPDSVGVQLRKGVQEGSVVLFTGAWADFLFWDGVADGVVDEAPGWDEPLTVEAFAALLDRLGGLFH